MVIMPVAAALAAVFMAALHLSGTSRYTPNACANVGSFLPAHVVGQDLAVRQLVDAVCEHLVEGPGGAGVGARAGAGAVAGGGGGVAWMRRKPLVVSVHGPPGVGKTYTHTLLARALYNGEPATALDCPGRSCAGAKVLYGMSYLNLERDSQLSKVEAAVLDHIRSTPNPLLVVEEYDKLDCQSRGLLRQLLRHPELANTSMSRAIVLLESNLGFLELEAMLTAAKGDKSAITPEAAESLLRSVVLNAWQRSPCESLEDTLSFGATVDFFLPFFPLTRPEITKLMSMELTSMYGSRLSPLEGTLVPEPAAVAWLVERVDFAGGNYPIEGAKQVSAVCIKHVSRLVRGVEEELRARKHRPQDSHVEYRLGVAPGGQGLQLQRVDLH